MHHGFPATWALFGGFFLALGSMNAATVLSLVVGGVLSLLLIFELTGKLWGTRAAAIAVLLFLSANVTWSGDVSCR
jgi:hypothetical protein